MTERHIVIIGGGLAGLSAGCYALRNGYRATIVEHNLALGGVCTAWPRDRYLVDGCIHWLLGGPFAPVYSELDIVGDVELRTLETWTTYRDRRDGLEVAFTRDLDRLVAELAGISPADQPELARLRDGAAELASSVPMPLDAPELAGLLDRLRALWELRGNLGSLVHFRKPVGSWATEHLRSARLRRIFTNLFGDMPAFFALMVLGYLEQGFMSRPAGGTAAFRDALERAFRERGGEALLPATVDEVLVRDDRAAGVRLADGTVIESDLVISTASAPETVLRLLGGGYDAGPTRERLDKWTLFDPIVLASFGVAKSYARTPSLLALDGIAPFEVGGRSLDHLYLRVCNDDPCFAPEGHTVIQAMMPTDYSWWASRGTSYQREKELVAEATLDVLEPDFPELRSAVAMVDVATPLTYWRMARSWRGSYEGWFPSAVSLTSHVDKTLRGLDRFYMAGQWVEPGGGVPTALMSGRQVIQLVCDAEGREFLV